MAMTKAVTPLRICPLHLKKARLPRFLGANGAGKSTLFLHLNGILQPEQGEVRFRGQPISYKKAGLRQLRSKVGIVFQNPDDQLFSASVYQDISFGAVNMGLPAEEVHRRVETVMEQVGDHIPERPSHSRPELRTEKAGGICRHYGHAAGSHYSGRAHGRTGPCGHQ